MVGVTTDRSRGRAGHIEQKRNRNIPLAAKLAGIEPIVNQPGAPFVERVVNYRLKVIVLAVDLAANAAQVFGTKKLKLIADLRDDSSVAASNHFHETARASRSAPLDYSAPSGTVVSKLTIPLVVIKSAVALFEIVFGSLSAA